MAVRRVVSSLIVASVLLILTSTLVSAQEEGFSVVLNPDSGEVGAVVKVEGIGFEAGSQIVISFDDIVIATGEVGPDGKFEIPIEVRAGSAGGCHEIKIKGKISVQIAEGLATAAGVELFRRFIIKPALKVKEPVPAWAFAGSTVTLEGSGFTRNANARLLFEGEELEVMFNDRKTSVWEINDVGGFAISFTVPETLPGEKTIQVFDAQGYMSQTSLLVTKESPLPPEVVPPRPVVPPPASPPGVYWAILGPIIAVAVFLAIFLPIRLRRRRAA